MGVSIKCILERTIPGVPEMDGKSLCMAYCGEAGSADGPADTDDELATNIVALDFGGPQPPTPSLARAADSADLLAPLDEFINGQQGIEWHDPAKGLQAVRGILAKLRAGATVSLDPDFNFFEENEGELTEEVTYDLETLEEIIVAAQKERTRFRLAIEG